MLIHASCAARDGNGVLFTGPPGSGKSDLVFRLLDRGFRLVADDQVVIDDDMASPPGVLAGLLEVRGLGIIEVPHVAPVRLVLSIGLGSPDRLPAATTSALRLPHIVIDPTLVSSAQRVELALDCALGLTRQRAGAFTR